MADGGRDAQGDAQGKERPSKPKAKRGGSGRKQTGTATPSKQSEREPEIASNLRELLELCARVLPQGSYSANSSDSNVLPLLAISEAYREHLRQKEVTPADALPLPANMMMRMMAREQAGNRSLAGCRHKTCFFVGPAPELAAIDHVRWVSASRSGQRFQRQGYPRCWRELRRNLRDGSRSSWRHRWMHNAWIS